MLKHAYNDNIKGVTKNIIFLAIICIEKVNLHVYVLLIGNYGKISGLNLHISV